MRRCNRPIRRAAYPSAKSSLQEVREVRVLALVHRTGASDEDPARRQRYLVSEWEIPVVEVVSETGDNRALT